MDTLELQLKNELKRLCENIPDDKIDFATFNLIDFYKLVVKIMQENQTHNFPENSSEDT